MVWLGQSARGFGRHADDQLRCVACALSPSELLLHIDHRNADADADGFDAQVRVATRRIYDPLEEDAFRPILHHYDGPKFRLELSVTEAIALLDIFAAKDDA